MAFNYTGNPLGVQAPSPAPGVGVAPILTISQDADAFDIANLEQPFKALADAVAFANQGLSGIFTNAVLDDDFWGDTFNRQFWVGAIPSGATIVTDPTAFGSLQLTIASSTSVEVDTPIADFSTIDFKVQYRARVPAIGGVGSVSILGMYKNPGNTLNYGFVALSGTANWQANVGGVNHDTGVAIGTAVYQVLEIRRVGTLVSFYIGGNLVYSESPSVFGTHYIALSVTRATSGTTTAMVDYVKIWSNR